MPNSIRAKFEGGYLISFLFKFTAAAVDGNFGPSRLFPNIFTTYLEACAWPRCVSAAFALVVLGL